VCEPEEVFEWGAGELLAVRKIQPSKWIVAVYRERESEMTDDDLIVRYDGDEIVGLTILHASQR
jgi:uncharacterized protein YuzE